MKRARIAAWSLACSFVDGFAKATGTPREIRWAIKRKLFAIVVGRYRETF